MYQSVNPKTLHAIKITLFHNKHFLYSQIEAFREIRSAHGKITHNFRPIQPIGDRVVFYNIDNNYYIYNEIEEHETTTGKPSKRKKGRNSAHRLVPTIVYTMTFTILLLFSL